MKKRILLLISMICFITTLLSPITANAASSKSYTVLIMLNGSDLESEDGAATSDLEEMMQIGSTDDVNIIVQTGGTKNWETEEIDADSIQRWYIEDGNMVELKNISNKNIGDADVTSDFIVWGVESYPADKYAFFFWNHGAGPIGGYGYDENYEDSLYFMENVDAFENAYAKTKINFELVGYDCCLMGSLEYAKLMSNYSNYFIASEELEPGHGWNYIGLFESVTKNPSITGDEWGKDIVDSFFAQAEDQRTATESTLSVLDLANVDALLSAFDSLVTSMHNDINNEDMIQNIIKARLNSEDYGASTYADECVDTVDLWDFSDNLSDYYPNETKSLKQEIENTVIYNMAGRDKPCANGVSLYWPAKNIYQFNDNYAVLESIYDGYGISSEYMMFLNEYAEYIKNSESIEFISNNENDYDDDYYNEDDDYYGDDDDYYGDEDSGIFSWILSWFFYDDDDDYYDDGDDYYDDGDYYYENDDDYYEDGDYYYDDDDYYYDDDDSYYDDDDYYYDDDSYRSNKAQESDTQPQASGELVDYDDGLALYVNPDSIDNIDSVYMCVGKYIDSSKKRVIILGLDTDVSISEDGEIFAELYQGWETLNGEYVPMYEMSYDQETNFSKYGIPVKLNGSRYYIIVVYSDEFPDGEITGARRINQRGIPDKNLVQIKAGDEVIPYYTYEDEKGDSGELLGNKFVVEDKLELGWEEFPPGEYLFGFEVVDIYQNRTYSDFFIYQYDENGVIPMENSSINWVRVIIVIIVLFIIIIVIYIFIKKSKKKKIID